MKNHTLIAAAAAALFTTLSAQAGIVDARFSGVVDSQAGSGFGVGAAVNGEFVYDTNVGRFLSFVIGGQSVAPGFATNTTLDAGRFQALFEAQTLPVAGVGNNSTFTLDLEALNSWPVGDPILLITTPRFLQPNLDTAFSSFGYYQADGAGNNVRRLNAALSSLQVSVVPEPGSAALVLAAGLAAAGSVRARRH